MMKKSYSKSIFWFRRDLRLEDQVGLHNALKMSKSVCPIFIFDREILDKLEERKDARVEFIHATLKSMKITLNELGSDLKIYYGNPKELWPKILDEIRPDAVFCNRDYEIYAKDRDSLVEKFCKDQETDFHSYKDHVVFDKEDVLKDDGTPYVVFTPYKRKWIEKLNSRVDDDGLSHYLKSYSVEKYNEAFAQMDSEEMIKLSDMDFERSEIEIPSDTVPQKRIKEYDKLRNFPAVDGTSRLGIHFRFGTISIREKARKALRLNDTFLSELVWRDFYAHILDAFPHVEENSFREKYDRIEWRNKEQEFEAWCKGETGYPMVDAGMRELNNTGYMHNRVRMVVASFLTKHLLIDWRWGEAYFAAKLLDFDLSSNNGGWQWAAGSGTDAAPYFRIFNPESQMKKFDKENKYIKKWVPEYGTDKYVDPIVDHKEARERCLSTYKSALQDA